MNQTSIIAAALIIGYIVFVIANGDSATWIALLTKPASKSTTPLSAQPFSPAQTTQAVNPTTVTNPLGSLLNQPPFAGIP